MRCQEKTCTKAQIITALPQRFEVQTTKRLSHSLTL